MIKKLRHSLLLLS